MYAAAPPGNSSIPRAGQPIKINGAIGVLCSMLHFVATSAAAAKLGVLFLNACAAKITRLTLEELGHPQTPSPIHINNSTTVGIVNDTTKRQKSRSLEMGNFWLLDGSIQKLVNFQYHPGYKNLADYPSKSHTGANHLAVHPFYVHMPTSPQFLQRAAKPSVRRGCVDKVGPTYIHKHVLPSILRVPVVDRTLTDKAV